MLRHLLLLCFLVVIHSRHVRHRRWGATTLRPAVELQDIPIIGFGEEISFHANQTWLHFRTEELPMGTRDKQCAEARFWIEGKRTRIRVYTCDMQEGGQCLMEKYQSVNSAKFCHQFFPFYHRSTGYTLHVIIERRPRKFQDRETELRFRRRRFGRQATREVAHFRFIGLIPCSSGCQKSSDEDFTTQVPLKLI